MPKSAGSAFTNPALGAALEAHRVRCVTIAGLFAKGCVRATAVAALRRGLIEEVLRDAVACSSDWSCNRALGRLTEGGARVTAVGYGRASDRTE